MVQKFNTSFKLSIRLGKAQLVFLLVKSCPQLFFNFGSRWVLSELKICMFGQFWVNFCQKNDQKCTFRIWGSNHLLKKINSSLFSSILNVERPFQRYWDKPSWKSRAGWKSTPLENSKMSITPTDPRMWFKKSHFLELGHQTNDKTPWVGGGPFF